MNVLEAIRTRRSVREYDPRPISGEATERMKDALRLAPSACNYQPWKFVLVTDPDTKQALVRAAKHQKFIAQAPLVVIGVGFPDQAYKHMGGSGNSADVDVAIALDHLTLAAAAEGLGTCWIGAFDEGAVRAAIGSPAGSRVIAMLPLGHPARPGLIHEVEKGRRKPEGEVFAYDRFS